MVSQGVLLSMDGDMRLYSCIGQVEFERDHGISFKILWLSVDIGLLNTFSSYFNCFKLLYIKMSSVKYQELSISSGVP